MSLGASILPEFDHETANTRKTLERVPVGKFAWKPHEKSSALGALSSHLANLISWTNTAIDFEEFDMAPGGTPVKSPEYHTREEILSAFDKNVSAARTAISAVTDERMFGNWALLAGGQKILEMPRVAVVRTFVLNHMIHHRAQLGVYLRLNDIPV